MIRVMLVDDEEDALNLLEILLLRIGDVEIAGRYSSPTQAIEALRDAPVDAVFLDNEMPGIKGMETARRMRNIRPQLPIVFTTAHAEYAVEAFEIQSTDYLLKPLQMARLERAVSRIRQEVSRAKNRPVAYIQCMGGFSVALPHEDGRTLPWRTNKAKEICAFLVHHEGKYVESDLIIESVWPGYDPLKARNYLYTCLSYLRKRFQEHHVPMSIERAGNGFAILLSGVAVDVAEFEGLMDGILLADEPDVSHYGKMNDLYKGAYMEGCDYHWAAYRQEAINAKYLRSLRIMHQVFRKRGNAALAVDSLQRVLAIAPDSEADGRALIRMHMEEGNRSEALRVYRQLEHFMQDELGVELEEETVQLYRKMGWFG